ncbi:MAG: cupin domain-containing protein [Candidatus Brocadiae bacterium]|nr:cupin domain-containing protein [Candidatus Brocadiia bacterium]
MERVNAAELEYRNGDSGPKYLCRGPKIDWGVLRFLPGQELGTHYHETVEETFYFTSGTPKMIVNGEEFRVRVGDAFRMEPGDVHNIINDTDGPTDAVFIKSAYLPKDKVDS